MARYKDLTGMSFGKLTVIEIDHFQDCPKSRRVYWKCKCECGNYKVIRSDSLTSGNTQSCGCYNVTCKLKPQSIKKHKLYRIYWRMKSSCYNINNRSYKYYGGRGITVCNEWLNSYESFYNWSISNGYREGLTIDRIDNNGNYEATNCRWVDMKVQNNNKRQRKTANYYQH